MENEKLEVHVTRDSQLELQHEFRVPKYRKLGRVYWMLLYFTCKKYTCKPSPMLFKKNKRKKERKKERKKSKPTNQQTTQENKTTPTHVNPTHPQ